LSGKIQRDELPLGELFRGLAEKDAYSILASAQLRAQEPGGFFFHQGDISQEFHLLERGRVKIHQVTGSGRQGLIHFVNPGEVFGFSALLPAQSCLEFAEALQRSQALAWKYDVLKRFTETIPQLAINLLRITAKSLVDLQQIYTFRVTQPVEHRVAWALVRLGRQIGKRAGDERLIIPEHRIQKNVADLAGTSVFTASRVLGVWERDGTLTKGRGRITVLKQRRLLKLADRPA
jgi:CRP/FNR family transcriptional regulator, nitrogen oxide reductase regulator